MRSRRIITLLIALGFCPAAEARTEAIFPSPVTVAVERDATELVLAEPVEIVGEKGFENTADAIGLLMQGLPAARLRFVRSGELGPEAYRLTIESDGATITASQASGFYYGGVTFWQLVSAAQNNRIAAMTVTDAPELGWRGAMLDSVRHFHSPEFVKRFIDGMAAHKLNRLQWHLTDDQGWRVEIKAFPRLTGVGAYRRPAVAPGHPAEPLHGGFYTQEQLREIVSYAAARGVVIVPEIEMPGHALAAIRAYPEWGNGVEVPSGIEAHWGIFPWLFNVEDSTFEAIETILSEVMEIFPSPVIHIGGDEAVKQQWRQSPAVQARIRSLGLADEEALQGWFTGRIAAFLAQKGRRLAGWDEVLEGGAPEGSLVTAWRGRESALRSIAKGYETVLAPASDLYFDRRQSEQPGSGPGVGPAIRLSEVLAFSPYPEELDSSARKLVVGIQGALWSELIRTEEQMAMMAFPRLAAVAENGWTGRRTEDRARFFRQLAMQTDRMKSLGLAPSEEAWRPDIAVRPIADGRAEVALSVESDLPIAIDTGSGWRTYTGPESIALPVTVRAQSGGVVTERQVTAQTVRDRVAGGLFDCHGPGYVLIEDDVAISGERALLQTSTRDPTCWLYRSANLEGVTRITLRVGQTPFNFERGEVRAPPPLSPAEQASGRFEVRLGDCGSGDRLAQLPIALAVDNPGISALSAPIAAPPGEHDLCIRAVMPGLNPIWSIAGVSLE